MLVDRRKSKKYWWTHDISLACKGSKTDMQKVASRLHKNNIRVMEMKDYLSISYRAPASHLQTLTCILFHVSCLLI